jgi:hypothetical protein
VTTKGKAVLYKAESEKDTKEEAIDKLASESEDCTIVDV